MSFFSRRKELGPILLGVWLVATGLTGLVAVNIPYLAPALHVLAIAAGVLTLLHR